MNTEPIYRLKRSLSFREKVFVACLFYYGLVGISPILGYIGVRPGVHGGPFIVGLLFLISVLRLVRVRKSLITMTVTLWLGPFIATLYWGDPRFLLYPTFFWLAVVLVVFTTENAFDCFIDIASLFFIIVLTGAFIGVLLAFIGMNPLFTFPNPDGRPNFFFLTTFTNSWWGTTIRPAGIYDEPGALSFMVCSIAACRRLRGKSEILTWVLLLLGMLTFSLAHFAYIFVHVLARKWSAENLVKALAIALATIVVILALGFGPVMQQLVIERLVPTETGRLAGDNRTWQFLNAIDAIRTNPSAFIFGVDPVCAFDRLTCKERFPLMGDNPLAPITYAGLLNTWPYYLLVFNFFIVSFRKRKYIVTAGIALLILQRPTVMGVGYSLMTLAVLRASCSGGKLFWSRMFSLKESKTS